MKEKAERDKSLSISNGGFCIFNLPLKLREGAQFSIEEESGEQAVDNAGGQVQHSGKQQDEGDPVVRTEADGDEQRGANDERC